MGSHRNTKKQTRWLVLFTFLTGGLVAATLFAAFSQGWFNKEALESAATTDMTSISSSEAVTSSDATASPTEVPATPTPIVIETDPAKLLLPIKSLPGYIPATSNSDGSFTKTFASDNGQITWRIYKNSQELVPNYVSDAVIAFPSPAGFTEVEGVLTFRGNNYRDAPNWGSADVVQKKLEIVWTQDDGAISGTGSYWPGSGWTGQPLIVHWPEETRQIMGIKEEFKNTDLVEVIYPVFDGNIYFLDLATGKQTRYPIYVGFGFKGTGSVDPR